MIKWLDLAPGERGLVVRIALLLGLIHISLKLLSLKKVSRVLDWLARTFPGSKETEVGSLQRATWAVSAAGRRLPGISHGPCLAQALAMQLLYRRQGLPAELCIGVAREGGDRLAAHAWVESAGQVVIGGPPEDLIRYTRLAALEGKLP